ncbi:MAG: type II toxin-antitoxin system VapC family toxin [Pseudomonadota bacterium]
MNVLLDTHALLWWLFDDPQLSAKARKAIKNPDHKVYASSASAWEIATKYRLGKLPGARQVVQHLSELLQNGRIEALPISTEHALAAGALPGPHRDPFDRMLIAQARMEKLSIITTDKEFQGYGVKIIW